MQKWQCRVAPSLGGGFAGTPKTAWGTVAYKDLDAPTVFFGLYGLPDFFASWRHKGRRAVLWAGSDITHFSNGYWLDDTGKLRISPAQLAPWLWEHCENYVENVTERRELAKFGINSLVVPSFLGNVNDYPIQYKHAQRPALYTSVSGNDFALYGWDEIDEIAQENPDVDFYLYGNTEPWYTSEPNVFIRGRVPQATMNREIKKMQGALRLTRFDGFSEILAKSVLWGQYPVSAHIDYPHMLGLDEIGTIKDRTEPNIEGREYYLSNLNKYPWNAKTS